MKVFRVDELRGNKLFHWVVFGKNEEDAVNRVEEYLKTSEQKHENGLVFVREIFEDKEVPILTAVENPIDPSVMNRYRELTPTKAFEWEWNNEDNKDRDCMGLL